MTADLSRCFHCGAEIPTGLVIRESVGCQGALSFCCRGCQGAYLLISGAGLDDFYRRRQWDHDGVPDQAYRQDYQDAYLAKFVYAGEKGSAIDIIIDGIRCASCVWLNERMLGRVEGVVEARVNYATGRARVTFDEKRVTPAAIFKTISALGYLPRPYTRSAAGESGRREQRDLLFRFGTAAFLTMQLMAYSFALYAGYLQGIDPETRNYLQLFSMLVTTPVIFYCGSPFLAGAWRSMKNLAPNMELLIAIGALSSYGYSVYATFAGGEVYFETAAMIVTLILIGRLLENAARRRACGGVERLLGLCPAEARRFRGEVVETVAPEELKRGDLILVAAGERFPVDGSVVEGETDVDESPATGEAAPVLKRAGDAVLAGTTNLAGAVRVRCESEASASFVARVARLVEEAQSRRAPIQGAADRVSSIFVPTVLTLAASTFCWHFLGGDPFGEALMTALAVVVIACPCALGLATPTAIAAGTGSAAGRGIIFKGGDVLERLSRTRIAVFDKTGTLTSGKPELDEVRPAEGFSADEIVSWGASLESGSLHPAARAIIEEAATRGIDPRPAFEIRSAAGGGVAGTMAGEEVAVGSRLYLIGLGVTGMPEEGGDRGLLVYLSRGGRYCGSFLLKDKLRSDAPTLVSYFRDAGISTVLFSGDSQKAAAEVAVEAGIGDGIGNLSPGEKLSLIAKLQEQGGIVLVVGDGINDAPALSLADVGCAVAGGTDIAIETSDLVLVKPDLERLASAHRIACRTMSVIRQNLGWAFLYNAVGIPLAMTGKLTPIFAAAAMAVSSLCVVANSLRLTEVRRG